MATLTITNKTSEPAYYLVWGRRNGANGEWSSLRSRPDGSTLVPLSSPGHNVGDVASVLDRFQQLDAHSGIASFPSLPSITSGQVFLTWGSKPKAFNTVRTARGHVGVQQPSVDPFTLDGKSTFASVELTITEDGQIWLNTTAVDAWTAPTTLTLTGSKGTQSVGQLAQGTSRDDFFRAFDTLAGPLEPFRRLVIRDAASQRVVRVLAPGHHILATSDNPFPSNYWDAYLAATLRAIQEKGPLEMVLRGAAYDGTYLGTVGDDKQSIIFRRPDSPEVVATVALRPGHAADIFFCNGDLRAPNNVAGALAARVGACINRSVLHLVEEVQPVLDPARWYSQSEWTGPADGWATNAYAEVVGRLVNRVYSFAFDDVRSGGGESGSPLLQDPRPSAVDVTLEPWS